MTPDSPVATQRDLPRLALDIHRGLVFGSWMIPPERMERDIRLVFMILYFIGPDDREWFENAAQLYEYYDKAGPRSINGYPSFFSAHSLNKQEWAELCRLMTILQDQQESFLKRADTDEMQPVLQQLEEPTT